MNAEKLNKVASELKREFDKVNLVNLVKIMRDNLQNMVNQPNQPAHQQNFVKVQKQLFDYLNNAPSNRYGPIWKQLINEIGGSDLIGNSLRNRIEQIMSSNSITPANALVEINTIANNIEPFYNALNQLVAGLNGLKIGKEELEPGTCEVSYLIPRNFTEENLTNLKKELSHLTFILNHISEVATGEKESFKVRSISSSDYSFYIEVSLLVGNILVIATEKIINTYKTILEIKNLRNQLKEHGVPDKETKGIEDHANSTMEKEILGLAKEIVKSHYKGKDTNRKNELINGLTISFNKIANRIDNGFNIDIRVEILPSNDDEKSENDVAKEELINSIKQSSESLEFINTSGKSILKLQEGKEDENGDTDNSK